ncbi:PREDICTED: complement component C8 gamma chain [Condylura cristata]|uniref:complement component C8 gamma chain n=1 Tax=Condylura cristata TaxID=143302 RepID=UPI0006431493|nr:PREDICTED: complement component C8 gamma chain [Condylura cristata]
MLPRRAVLLLTLLLAPGSLGQWALRPPRPPQPQSPISAVQPKADFDAQQFAGTWFLVAVASSCRNLWEPGHRAEATALQVTPQGSDMAVSTFRKLDGICWQVRELYRHAGRPGRFQLQEAAPQASRSLCRHLEGEACRPARQNGAPLRGDPGRPRHLPAQLPPWPRGLLDTALSRLTPLTSCAAHSHGPAGPLRTPYPGCAVGTLPADAVLHSGVY